MKDRRQFVELIIQQMFSLACDWSKVSLFPSKSWPGYIQVIFPIFKTTHVAKKYLKDNKHTSLHLQDYYKYMLGYLPLDIICSSKLQSSHKTVLFLEQILSADKYPGIFPCQMETTFKT